MNVFEVRNISHRKGGGAVAVRPTLSDLQLLHILRRNLHPLVHLIYICSSPHTRRPTPTCFPSYDSRHLLRPLAGHQTLKNVLLHESVQPVGEKREKNNYRRDVAPMCDLASVVDANEIYALVIVLGGDLLNDLHDDFGR